MSRWSLLLKKEIGSHIVNRATNITSKTSFAAAAWKQDGTQCIVAVDRGNCTLYPSSVMELASLVLEHSFLALDCCGEEQGLEQGHRRSLKSSQMGMTEQGMSRCDAATEGSGDSQGSDCKSWGANSDKCA